MRRADCWCAAYRKPCAYHEGAADAVDVMTEPWSLLVVTCPTCKVCDYCDSEPCRPKKCCPDCSHYGDAGRCPGCGGSGEAPNPEAVAVVGKAFFDADDSYRLPWDQVEEGTRQWYREKAEAGLVGLLEWMKGQQ